MRHLGGRDPLECANLTDHTARLPGDGLTPRTFLRARGRLGRWRTIRFGTGSLLNIVDTVESGGCGRNLQRGQIGTAIEAVPGRRVQGQIFEDRGVGVE